MDVAKEDQYALITTHDQSVSVLVKWNVFETTGLINGLQGLNCPIAVAMESTGTYGDAMRYHFTQAGFKVYQVSAKRVHDAKEIFDGVPSLHDAKAACLIALCTVKGWAGLGMN